MKSKNYLAWQMMLFSTQLKLASCILLVSLLTHLLTSTPLSPTHTHTHTHQFCTYRTKLVTTSCVLKTLNLLIRMNKVQIILKYVHVIFLVYISLCARLLLCFQEELFILEENRIFISRWWKEGICLWAFDTQNQIWGVNGKTVVLKGRLWN